MNYRVSVGASGKLDLRQASMVTKQILTCLPRFHATSRYSHTNLLTIVVKLFYNRYVNKG